MEMEKFEISNVFTDFNKNLIPNTLPQINTIGIFRMVVTVPIGNPKYR